MRKQIPSKKSTINHAVCALLKEIMKQLNTMKLYKQQVLSIISSETGLLYHNGKGFSEAIFLYFNFLQQLVGRPHIFPSECGNLNAGKTLDNVYPSL